MEETAIKTIVPTDTLVRAMESLDNATYAVVVTGNSDGTVTVIDGGLPEWLVLGLLKWGMVGYEPGHSMEIQESE